MLAIGVIVVIVALMMAGGVFAAGWCKGTLCRRRERRSWDDLVASHRDLDRELTRIWQRR